MKPIKDNRKSTVQINYPRNTTMSMVNKNTGSDPRPIKDSQFQTECMSKICNFLIQESYSKNLNMRDLTSPQSKDFISIFTFIYERIFKNSGIVINKLDEDLPPILNELRYPGYIGKNHLLAVGAPNIWPHMLSLLSWMVELASYIRYDLEIDYRENIERVTVNNTDLHYSIFDRYYHNYILEAYSHHINNGDITEVRAELEEKVRDLNSYNNEQSEKILYNIRSIEDKISEINETSVNLNEAKKKFDIIIKEVEGLTKAKIGLEKQLHTVMFNIENRSRTVDIKEEKNKELTIQYDELDNTVKTQKVSFDEFEKMKNLKTNYEKQITALEEKFKELNDKMIMLSENIENTKNITERAVRIRAMLQNNNKADYEIEIEKYVYEISNKDPETLKEEFSIISEILSEDINNKNSEIKEKEEILIYMKSQLLKLDDKIHEISELLRSKEHENDKKNSQQNQEKDKFTHLLNQKNEEINKLEENINKTNCQIIEKDKEYERLKMKETQLNNIYLEKETETDKKVKEFEKEFLDLYSEVEKTKAENIKEIRKNYKTYEKIFESIRKELE
jgi:SMC interacting uncharacterized protein involved in chromosome segregation